jgi:PAS domain S-box-containing protein
MADAGALYGLILPEHLERMARAEEDALARHAPFDIEVAFRRPDGEVRWHRIASAPTRLDDGSTLWDGIQIDITAAKLAEIELEEQRRRLQVAVEATGLGFWEWDLRSDQLTFSDRNRELIGLGPDDTLSIPGFMSTVHPDDRSAVQAAYRAARDGGGDFAVEYRVQAPGDQTRWLATHGRVVRDALGPVMAVGTSLDVTARKTAEETRTLLMGELAHRAKNGLAIIMAIASQTARGASTVEDYEALLTSRLQAMAESQALITGSGGRPPALDDLAAAVLAPFGLSRFDLDAGLGKVGVSSDIALGLALLLHEMATNALKYGALSKPGGRVAISRVEAEPRTAKVAWLETGGPPVKPSSHRGFGSRLLQAALRNQGGRVVSSFEPAGFEATLEFPAAD